ncbi:hypothetical protein B0H14DRAFT_2581049 [Mycena olivaceomarginata]|nr:hypothetical protein B0H14DRAFT_2581049 [Mycena olivaceomarginata]
MPCNGPHEAMADYATHTRGSTDRGGACDITRVAPVLLPLMPAPIAPTRLWGISRLTPPTQWGRTPTVGSPSGNPSSITATPPTRTPPPPPRTPIPLAAPPGTPAAHDPPLVGPRAVHGCAHALGDSRPHLPTITQLDRVVSLFFSVGTSSNNCDWSFENPASRKTAPRARSSNQTSSRAGSSFPCSAGASSPALNTQYFKCEHIRAAKGTYPAGHGIAGALAPASPLHISHSARNQQTRQPQSHFEGGGNPNGSSDDELSDAPDSNNMHARAASPFNKDVLYQLQMSSSGFFNHPIAGRV